MNEVLPRCVFGIGTPLQCSRPGIGNPPMCQKHYAMTQQGDGLGIDSNDLLAAALNVLLGHPKVASIVEGVKDLLDENGRAAADPHYAEWPPRPPPAGGERPGAHSPPRPQAREVEDPRVVMGFSPAEDLYQKKIKVRRRALSALYHPDVEGGSEEAMKRLNLAADALLRQNP